MDPSEWLIVIPSIRTIQPDYLAAIPPEIALVIVDDSDGAVSCDRAGSRILRYADRRALLGSDEDLIPQKSDTCRSLGFWLGWKEGYRYVITLDDDCATHAGFVDHHSIVGSQQQLKTVSGPDRQGERPSYNTLDNLVFDGKEAASRWYARGYPYDNRPGDIITPLAGGDPRRVVCNMGLWLNVPDVNGVDKLERELPTSVAAKEARLAIASGTNFSLCIMNVCFLGELAPAFYQLPMNVVVGDGKLDRFGDIWAGYILKKLVDVAGDAITIGEPLVTHTKAGNTQRETRVEHYGHLLADTFYRLVDEATSRVSPDGYSQMYAQFAEQFTRQLEATPLPAGYRRVFDNMASKMRRWAALTAER